MQVHILDSIESSIPLVVDLDDTLVRTDTLHEALINVLFRTPLAIPKLFLHLFKGRATLKEAAASTAKLNVEFLSYRREVLDLVHRAKSAGRSVHLVTAADQRIADAVQQHLGCFDSVKGSDGKVNLKGRKKLS